MLYRTLGDTGLSLSRIGFGASPLGDVFGRADPAEGIRAVHEALDQGINFFDVSPYYGATLAEERLGQALRGRRAKAVLATKCGRYGAAAFDFSAARIKSSIDESLERLETDYVDLFQAHDIEFGDPEQIVDETIPALREVQCSGKARFIGITGYPLEMLISVATRKRVDTILSYCHFNLLATDLAAHLAPFAEQNGIGLINASPLHMGLLSGTGAPEWHPAPIRVRAVAAEVAQLCRQHRLDPVLVALRFSLGHPYIASTLIGMSTRQEVRTNIKALEFDVSPDFLEKIEQVVAPVRDVNWPSGRELNADRNSSSEKEQQVQ